jgi:stalled ribosome rescue protein Dom34
VASDDVVAVQAMISSGQDRTLLKLLRDEATTCVLMVRLANEERKAEWARREAERQAEDRAVSEWLIEDDLFNEAQEA